MVNPSSTVGWGQGFCWPQPDPMCFYWVMVPRATVRKCFCFFCFFLAVECPCHEKGTLAMATATIKKCHLRMNNCAVVTLKFWFSHWRSRLQLKSRACAADWIKHCCRLKSWSNLQNKNYVTSKLCNKRLLNIKTTKRLCNAWVQTIFLPKLKMW